MSRVNKRGGTRAVERTVHFVTVDDRGEVTGSILDKAEGWRPVVYDYDAKRWRPGEYPGPDKRERK